MRFLGILRVLGAVLWLSSGLVAAKKDEPEIHIEKFDSPQLNLFFFEDSEVVMIVDGHNGAIHRSDNAGEEWEALDDINKHKPWAIFPHPYDNQVAVILSQASKGWITDDQGKSWTPFDVDGLPSQSEPISFHATDSKRFLLHLESEDFLNSIGKSLYTTNGFKTTHTLHERRKTCMWAKSHDQFSGNENVDKDGIVCIVEGKSSPYAKDFKLVFTDDYFETEIDPTMSNGRSVTYMTNMASVKAFLVAAARAGNSREMALYVSKDALTWHRAEFGTDRLEEDAYTILESTNYSLQIEVMTERQFEAGILYTSNSNGTYFTKNIEHVNRNQWGYVDFEKVSNIQGIVLVNEIDNWERYTTEFGVKKEVKSKISFDDGRTWEKLKVKDSGEELHLHSVTEQRNSGRIFSSPAPGMVMGNGNTGLYLEAFSQSSFFVSDDAGRTWLETDLKGPQKYEFGDQGALLVAVADRDAQEISYSINHGRTWNSAPLPDDIKGIDPFELTTIPDSTSLKFIMEGKMDENYYLISFDFGDLHERKCKEGDFEKWYARVDDDKKPTCIMGHKQWFRRRKADTECFIDKEFKEAMPESEPCDCKDADFECDYNFKPSEDGKDCVPATKVLDPDGQCKNSEDTFNGPSGWRLIPGNDCKRVDGKQKDDPIKRPCDEAIGAPASGDIESEKTMFRGQRFLEIVYLERGQRARGDDETVVMLTDEQEAWITHDQGKTWKIVVDDIEVEAIYPHAYNNDYVYFITPSKDVWYSKDRGYTLHSFKVPELPSIQHRSALSFHQLNHDWIIWTGGVDCSSRDPRDPKCHNVAHVSKNNGLEWHSLLRYVQKCMFMFREGRSRSEDLIYCEQYQAEDVKSPLQLLSTEDDFKHKTVEFGDIVDFASMDEFIVVAAKVENNDLQAQTSIDGRTFAHAAWPSNFDVKHETAYTVLDSSTNAVFIHVTVNPAPDREYGSILKSNSNGTWYILSLNDVNRNREGYVDFERMQGVEGVALVNLVANAREVDDGARKKLKSMITHDDGAFWAPLPPPEKNMDGQKFCAGESIEKCSLHLHSYTERRDPRDTFSSPSAVGLMVGVGNVGEFLGPINEGDTFLTSDGGITWNHVQKGTYLWEYGDQGSIIVLVSKDTPTNTLLYSVNEGKSFKPYDFSDEKMIIEKISTVPSDNSRNFILWGKENGKLTTVNVDFTGLTDELCYLDKENPTSPDSDYYLWSPQHPYKKVAKDCLFGHKSRYYRKKPESVCYNGPMVDRLHDIEKNCSCTRQDFEWYV
jgi:Sortilin, neurotensin receptor 3,/Sortilin, neurotensin receptor 3, C-terminal